MPTKKTTAKPTTETQTKDKSHNETLEQSLKDRKPDSSKSNGKETGVFNKADQTIHIVEKPGEDVTLEQALKEEGEGRTPESINSEGKKQTGGTSKVEKAMKIMKEMWDDIQSGKVKRKDVVKRFMEETPLSKAGSSTYYSNCKQKIMKGA